MSAVDEILTASAGEVEERPVDLPAQLRSPGGLTGAIHAAIDAQRGAAVSYVRSIRRRHPDASPAEVIASLERHYLVSVTASGSAVGATAFIPGAGTVIAIGAGAAELLLQFELAALFGLAVAEVHGLDIQERDRARAMILSLMLGQDGRGKVAAIAKAAIRKDPSAVAGAAGKARRLAGAKTVRDLPLGDLIGAAVPGDLMPMVLDAVMGMAMKRLPEKAATAATRLVPGGIGLVLGGIGGWTAGNEVVQAARGAFGAPPERFPEWLEPTADEGEGSAAAGDATEDAPGDAAAVADAGMRGALGRFVQFSNDVVGAGAAGVSNAASAVGTGVASAAATVSRPFRSVDLDGDGVPDEAQALTAVKRTGSAIRDVALGGVEAVGSLFARKAAGADEQKPAIAEAEESSTP